ncbi:unnamed protein product [Paramecium octaurelia]|uniref:Uncharacterized protein n=1 Tax=Paramecium octaurelia TaxID=43137 RepID=A0A8S1XCZ2_PAROT|nr:unnamed protein product [Paramecium octaurelia]
MKHIECPIKLASASVQFPSSQFFNTNKARNQILCRIYGHFIFGFTQQSPKDYYQKYSIQVEGRLLDKIQEWAEYMRYQNLPKVILNKKDENDNPIIQYFFPDDDNIGWIYNDQNIHLNILSTNLISGVCIDRSKNLEKKNYSMFQEKTTFTYKFSAKHIPEAPPSQTFMQHQIEFISNRFPQLEGNPEEGYRRHILQIETLAGRKWFEKIGDYYITDVDNCLEGNPHLIQ